jgi:ABC-2 type transport system permease protein
MRKRLTNRYTGFIKAGVLGTFVYKFAIFGWLIGDIVALIIYCFLWIAVFANSPTATINGFTSTGMLAYVVSARIIGHLVNSSSSFYNVGSDIRDGTIANRLSKPINYRRTQMYSSIGQYIGSFILFFFPLYVPAQLILHFAFGVAFPAWYNILLFILSSFLSMLIIDSFDFIIGQVAFFTGALFGVMLVKDSIMSFLSGGMIPLSFFPRWLQTVFNFLPFASMLQTPAFIALGMYDLKEAFIQIGWQCVWVIFLGLHSYVTFGRTVKRVISVGG